MLLVNLEEIIKNLSNKSEKHKENYNNINKILNKDMRNIKIKPKEGQKISPTAKHS